jgi:RhoGAP domain
LPEINRAVLTEIISLAVDVVAHENINKMSADNMARVIGPNLVNLDSYSAHLSMIAIQAVNEVARIMITQFDQLFPGARRAAPSTKPTPTSASQAVPLTASVAKPRKKRTSSRQKRTLSRKSSAAMVEAASAFSSSAATHSHEDLLQAVAELHAAVDSPRANLLRKQQCTKTLPMTPPQLRELQEKATSDQLNSPGVLTRSQARRLQLLQELEEGSTAML